MPIDDETREMLEDIINEPVLDTRRFFGKLMAALDADDCQRKERLALSCLAKRHLQQMERDRR
jgi:hypothetical protein